MAAKPTKAKRGSTQTRIIFAPMPGKTVSTGGGLTNFVLSDAGIERFSTHSAKIGRWLEPGEGVSAQGFNLPDGMIYFGATLTALNGYGSEPSLIDPSLPAAKPQAGSVEQTRFFQPDYKSLSPGRRWKYLQWLAHGRSDPQVDGHLVYLFFYGIERRIISPHVRVTKASQHIDEPLTDGERQDLRNELLRLAKCYNHPTFQGFIGGLFGFLDLTTVLADPANMDRLNSEALAATTRSGGPIPTLLAVALARFASSKQQIPADWAWAWFCQDADSNLRAVVTRCPKEMRRLFRARFVEAVGPKGLTLRLTKTAIPISYHPVGPGYSQSVSATAGTSADTFDWLRQVGRTPLKAIREIADACMDELDAYSRRVGRDPHAKHTLPVVALLPDPLFQEHDAAVKFRAWLNTFVPAESGAAATIPAAELIARWQGSKQADSQASLSRSEALTLLDGIGRLGFAIEPDLRTGGPALAGPTAAPSARNLVAALARRASRPAAAEFTASPTLFVLGLPLLVRAARASEAAESPELRRLAHSLPYAESSDPASLAARLAYLVANPKESAKIPKPKDLSLEFVPDEERHQIADVIAAAASLSGSASPAAVAELIRLFALMGLPDSEVFARLHHTASIGSARRAGTAAKDDGLATIRSGSHGTEHAIPKPAPRSTKKTADGRVAIDQALVRQKEAESAQISSLLADIFTEEETVPMPIPVSASEPTSAAPTGGLEPRHAALLRALLTKDSWSKAEVAALARAENLLPNAALDAINEAAFERFDEPVVDGDDPIYVTIDLAKEMLS